MLASIEGVAARLSDEEVIFQPRGSTDSQVMTMQVLELMDQSRPFQSVDVHVAQALRKVPGLRSADAARQALATLARVGLLQSDADWLAALTAPAAATAPEVPFAGLAIRACDRPQQVERLLASLADYEARFAARRPLWLLDDSRDAAAAAGNRRLLGDYARSTGAPTTYLSPAAGAAVAKWLRKALPQFAAAADALLTQQPGSAGGRNWNLLLLLTAGRRLIMLDEDFVFPLRRHPDAQDGIDPAGVDQSTVRFYDSLDAALAAGTALDADPIEQHLAWLGASMAGVAATGLTLNRQDLRGLPLADLAHLTPAVRVLTTHIGTRGASGSSDNSFLFELDPDARDAFWRDRDSYLHNLDAHSIWFGHRRARIAPQGFFSPFGLDNSVLTPCTTTAGRNEDAVFGTLLRFCHPDGVTLHMPQAIGHMQEGARQRTATNGTARAPGFNRFLYEQLQNADPAVRAADPAVRMRFAGAILENLAASSDQALATHLREYRNYTHANLIERLQQQLVGNPGAPVYWQADLRALIERNARAMIAKTAPRLDGWPEGIDDAACAGLLRGQLQAVATALEAWPALWQYARDHADELRKVL